MNQILCTKYCNLDIFEENDILQEKKKHLFKFQVFFLFSISVSTLIYYLYSKYDLYSHERISKNLIDTFELTSIYKKEEDYSVKKLSTEEIYFYENSSFSIIGKIYIKKINISYPILSDISKDFLKIAPCRFYGPMPNEIR